MNYTAKSYITKHLVPALLASVITGFFNYLLIESTEKSFLAGIVFGLLIYTTLTIYNEIYHYNVFRNIPTYLDVLISTAITVITILFWVSVVLAAFYAKNAGGLWSYLGLLYDSAGMAMGLSYGITFSFVINFLLSVKEIIGSGNMTSLILGTYSRPREEERIFMFLDLKSSTALAERLGNKAFLNLLNDFFFTASEGISKTKGTIYKYVGDEVIVTWPLEKGIHKAQALKCFFLIEAGIQQRHAEFQRKYGAIPDFKAGMHCGTVIAGELGYTKKEITYMGDVLNTTARIEAECNLLQERLLISEQLKSRLPEDEQFSIKDKGEATLRGKHVKLRLFSVTYN